MLLYAVKLVVVCKVSCSGCHLLICQRLLSTYAWHGTPNKLYNFTLFVVLHFHYPKHQYGQDQIQFSALSIVTHMF